MNAEGGLCLPPFSSIQLLREIAACLSDRRKRLKMKVKRFFVISLIIIMAAATFLFAANAAGTNIVAVTPTQMHGWLFYNDETDQIDNSLGTFVVGPGVPGYPIGSAQISVSGTQRRNLATYQFAGTPLAAITSMRFSTFNPSAGNGGGANRSAYLNFNVDFNGSDTWQRRLVFVPGDNGIVTQNNWKEWDTIRNGTALWRYSGATWPVTGGSGTVPKTWSQILTDYPIARIRVTDAHMGIRVGEPYESGYTENIDSFSFGVSDGQGGENLTIFNFEPNSSPTSPDQCKGNGWRMFNPPAGPFKNQGECVSSVVSNRGGNN